MPSFEIPFAIGDVVWKRGSGSTERQIVCPDCAGTRAITLILGNGTQQTMDCNVCARGYDRPSGIVTVTDYDARPTRFVCNRICGFRDGQPEYTESPEGSNCYTTVQASDLYRTEAECEAACKVWNEQQAAYRAEQAGAYLESKRRDMAFSSHYWARKVKDLERDLVLARDRLARCPSKAASKEPK